MRNEFNQIYESNYWRNDESVSGHGSTLEATVFIREVLPRLFRDLDFGVRSVLDIPCGDFNWLADMTLDVDYIGADIVPDLIESNRVRYPGIDFRVMDVTKDFLPAVDLILCRDLLGHFSSHEVRKALRNIKNSGAKYLLATTFPEHENSGDILTGEWRPINLAQLWGLPDPALLINEGCTAGGGQFADKSLGLWRLSNV